ncbi:MAG: sulfite exporter TauE/SafE family protein [Ruminococcaceae bacterium]|nr:sulfite exporter TauE/SafE family protein [Oscillospiraceae bacterium]
MKYKKEIIIGIVAGILNGLFGAGGGCIVVPALEKFLDFPQKKAHGTAVGIILIMSIASAVIYVLRGKFNFSLWIPVTVGGCIGGIIGGKLLSKIAGKWLRTIFGVVIIITSIKMIF